MLLRAEDKGWIYSLVGMCQIRERQRKAEEEDEKLVSEAVGEGLRGYERHASGSSCRDSLVEGVCVAAKVERRCSSAE